MATRDRPRESMYGRRWTPDDQPQRRDSANVPRDRGRDGDVVQPHRDTSRDRLNGVSRPGNAPNRDRPDGIPTPGTSHSPNPAPAPTAMSDRQDQNANLFSKTLRKFGDYVADLAELKHAQSRHQRVAIEREADIQNSKARHREYPAASQLHQKFTVKHEAELKWIKTKEINVKGLIGKVADQFAKELMQAVSGATKHLSAPESQNDTLAGPKSSTMEPRLKALEERFAQLEGQQKRLEDDQRHSRKASKPDGGPYDELKRLHSAESERMTSMNQKIESLKQENKQIKSEKEKLESSVAALETKLANLAETETKQNATLAKLSKPRPVPVLTTEPDFAKMRTELDQVQVKQERHDQLLIRFKPSIQDNAEDFLHAEMPAMIEQARTQKAAIARLETELKSVKQAIPANAAAASAPSQPASAESENVQRYTKEVMEQYKDAHMKQYTKVTDASIHIFTKKYGDMMDTYRQQVEATRNQVEAHEQQIKDLKSSSLANRTESQQPMADMQVVGNLELQQLRNEQQAVIEDFKQDVTRKLESMTMMITILDAQYNNLTTRTLYDAIIAHMQSQVPNIQSVQEDISRVWTFVDGFVDDYIGLESQYRESLEIATRPMPENEEDEEDERPEQSLKRRRLDQGSNDAAGITNGHN